MLLFLFLGILHADRGFFCRCPPIRTVRDDSPAPGTSELARGNNNIANLTNLTYVFGAGV